MTAVEVVEQLQTQNAVVSTPLTGTPYRLGHVGVGALEPSDDPNYTVDIPISGDSVPSSAIRIDLEISVAGRVFEESFDPLPDQTYTFTWDGLDDAGRAVVGVVPATVRIANVFIGVFAGASSGGGGGGGGGGGIGMSAVASAFNLPSNVGIAGDRSANEITYWVENTVYLGALTRTSGVALGWTLDAHHQYDPVAGEVLFGDGTVAGTGTDIDYLIDTLVDPQEQSEGGWIAAFPGANAIAIAPDGSVYFYGRIRETADGPIYTAILRRDRDGSVEPVLGGATQAAEVPPLLEIADETPLGTDLVLGGEFLPAVNDMAAAPDGSLYLSYFDQEGATGDPDHPRVGRIFRLRPDGRVERVAGTGLEEYRGDEAIRPDGDGGPAAEARLGQPWSIALGPDGTLYFNEFIYEFGFDRTDRSSNGYRVLRAIDAAGRLSTLSAPPADSASNVTEGRPLSSARLFGADRLGKLLRNPAGTLAVDPDGIVHFSNYDTLIQVDEIWALQPDGTPKRLTGRSAEARVFDGGSARLDESMFRRLRSFEFDLRGDLYVLHYYFPTSRTNVRENLLSIVDATGRIRTIAGLATADYDTDNDGRSDGDRTIPRERVAARTVELGIGGGREGMAVAPDGTVCVTELVTGVQPPSASLARVLPTFPVFNGTFLVPAADGTEVYEFDATGRHLRTRSALTGTTLLSFDYDDAGLLVTATDANGGVTAVERDTGGSPTAMVAPGGDRTLLSTDADGRIAAITDPVGGSAGLEYTPAGLVRAVVDAEGHRTELDYDEDARLVEVTDAAGGVTSLVRTRDEDTGEVRLTVLSPELRETTYTARSVGGEQLVLTTNCCGGVETEVVERAGGTTTITYPDGRVATLSEHFPDPRYGALAGYTGEARVERPSGLTSRVGRERSSSIGGGSLAFPDVFVERTVVGSRVLETTIDIPDRTVTARSPAGRTTVANYDADGRLLRTSTDDALVVEYTYDEGGRVASLSSGDARVAYGYDDRGRWVSVTDSDGGTFGIERDDGGRPIRLVPASGADRAIDLSYDARDDLTTLTAPNGDAHALAYTPLGRLQRYTDPLGNTREIAYDGDGAPIGVTLPSGRTVSNRFDAGGRIAGLSRPEANLAISRDGQLLTNLTRTPTDGAPAQTLTVEYDGSAPVAVEFSGAVSGRYTYEYNDAGGLVAVTHPDGTRDELVRDPGGLVIDTGAFGVIRAAPGGLPTMFADDTFTQTVDYDATGEVIRRETSVDGAVVHRLDYTYDATGQLVELVETVDGTTTTRTYGYDTDGQVTSVAVDGTTVETYAYDDNGNRVERTTPDGTATATVGPGDRLTAYDGVTYVHDADGFLVSRGADAFTYGTDGGLLSATVGGETVTYGIDGLARRVSRTDAGGTTEYLYGDPDDRFRVTTVRDPDGTLTTYRYDDIGRLLSLVRDGATYYIATDDLGSPLAVYDATGTTVRRLTYDAFGRVADDTAPGFALHIGFAGGLVDPVTGLLRFGFRDYDPDTGRWTALDPLLFASGQSNLYTYVHNDPVNFVDPTGLSLGKRSACFWKEVERDYQTTANWEETAIRETLNVVSPRDTVARDAKGLATVYKDGKRYVGTMRDLNDSRAIRYADGTYSGTPTYDRVDRIGREGRMLKAGAKSLGKGVAVEAAFKSGAYIGATIDPFRDYSFGDLVGQAIFEAINGPSNTINCDVANKKC